MKTKERTMEDTMNKVAKKPVPKIKKAERFWARTWERPTNTSQRKRMNTVTKKIGQKVMKVQKFMITEKKLHQKVRK